MIQDIQKGNRNNQIVSASKVFKSEVLKPNIKPSLEAESYLHGQKNTFNQAA